MSRRISLRAPWLAMVLVAPLLAQRSPAGQVIPTLESTSRCGNRTLRRLFKRIS